MSSDVFHDEVSDRTDGYEWYVDRDGRGALLIDVRGAEPHRTIGFLEQGDDDPDVEGWWYEGLRSTTTNRDGLAVMEPTRILPPGASLSEAIAYVDLHII